MNKAQELISIIEGKFLDQLRAADKSKSGKSKLPAGTKIMNKEEVRTAANSIMLVLLQELNQNPNATSSDLDDAFNKKDLVFEYGLRGEFSKPVSQQPEVLADWIIARKEVIKKAAMKFFKKYQGKKAAIKGDAGTRGRIKRELRKQMRSEARSAIMRALNLG
jgi:hypothetical protein